MQPATGCSTTSLLQQTPLSNGLTVKPQLSPPPRLSEYKQLQRLG